MLKALYHYLLILRSGLFDRGYYLLANPDVRKADVDALWHFLHVGWKEGRNPSPLFDTTFYLNSNPDVMQLSINPLVHYVRHGKKEGRPINPGLKPGTGNYDFEFVQQDRETSIPVFSETNLKNLPQNLKEEKQLINSIISIPEIEKPAITENCTDKTPLFDVKVSVIIPTKNAGNDFDFLLKILTNQECVREIEIVVVDSGSTDNTVNLAESYGAKVIEISPEEFSHSYTRNLGAQNASGEYLLFTVQDALPPSRTWLHSLLTKLSDEEISVVSCAELPREDADLFYRVISWNHYEFLDVNKGDRILSMPDEPNHINLRKNGQLSDLACLIPTDLFSQYQYRFSYAEDLDLGIRLIKDGHKIAFLGTTRIIHSHNRPAFYFMKRGFVDNLFLSDIFSDFVIPPAEFTDIAQDILFTFHFINNVIFNKISEMEYPTNMLIFEAMLKKTLHSANEFAYPTELNFEHDLTNNQELCQFINHLIETSGYPKAGSQYDGKLIKALTGFINMTNKYLKTSRDYIDQALAEEIKNCIIKEASIISGANLAYAYINGSDSEKERMQSIHQSLKASV